MRLFARCVLCWREISAPLLPATLQEKSRFFLRLSFQFDCSMNNQILLASQNRSCQTQSDEKNSKTLRLGLTQTQVELSKFLNSKTFSSQELCSCFVHPGLHCLLWAQTQEVVKLKLFLRFSSSSLHLIYTVSGELKLCLRFSFFSLHFIQTGELKLCLRFSFFSLRLFLTQTLSQVFLLLCIWFRGGIAGNINEMRMDLFCFLHDCAPQIWAMALCFSRGRDLDSEFDQRPSS